MTPFIILAAIYTVAVVFMVIDWRDGLEARHFIKQRKQHNSLGEK